MGQKHNLYEFCIALSCVLNTKTEPKGKKKVLFLSLRANMAVWSLLSIGLASADACDKFKVCHPLDSGVSILIAMQSGAKRIMLPTVPEWNSVGMFLTILSPNLLHSAPHSLFSL